MKGRTVVVTGTHGFLGRQVARHFSRAGAAVIGIGHGSWRAGESADWGLGEWHEADVTAANLRRCRRAPDVLVHCAGSGSPSFSLREPELDFNRTVGTTVEVLDYLRTEAPAARLVYLSSGAVYGATNLPMLGETVPLEPVSPYGRHKCMAEDLCRSAGERSGVASAVVRLFSVYGPGLRKQLLWDACEKFRRGEATFHGTGDEVRDWLHVDDAVELLAVAAQRASPSCPVINGGTGQGVAVREIVATLAAGAPYEFTAMAEPKAITRMVADISAARSWGWAPRWQWREGVTEYLRWYRQQR